MNNFEAFALPKTLQKSLEKLTLKKPTEVQVKTIPSALDGKDVIVSAPTGTGKTLAFSIPAITNIINNENYHALIITPTRELANQIHNIIKSLLSHNHNIKAALLIGGMPMEKQFNSLKQNPAIIIGTPGRINDHLSRKTLKLSNTKLVVLDEMDRMLDMGFSVQIDQIFEFIKPEKQVLMLSATIPPAIRKLSQKYLKEPEKVTIDAAEIVNTDIKQEFIHIDSSEKFPRLLEELTKREGTIIIFVKTRRNTEDLAKKLVKQSFKAKAIHGGLRQHQRDKILRLFREEKYNIVIATDVAARGIDVPHIKHVINYNLPTNPEDYVHRVGRTGRAGQEGYALCFISSNEKKEWFYLDNFLNPGKKPQKQHNDHKKPQQKKFGFRNKGNKNFNSKNKSFNKNKPSRKKPVNRNNRNS